MKELLPFFIELLIASAIFWLGYLIIRNYSSAQFRRYYLLAWMALSIAFPLISIESEQAFEFETIVNRPTEKLPANEPVVESKLSMRENQTTADLKISESQQTSESSVDWNILLLYTYLTISSFFFFRVWLGIFQVVRLKAISKPLVEFGKTVYQVSDPSFKGASFFGWIFIGKDVKEREVIIRHERVHHQLWHSIDIVFANVYHSVFWFSPFSWLVKKYIGLNTELEADAHMVKSENRVGYANVLLALSHGMRGSAIMNHFSAFHLKSRIVALAKASKHQKWVSFFSVAITMVLFVLVSCEKVGSSELVMNERMKDVKSITSRFISHQSDTQQKTGKIVAIANFLPDGTLDELVEQTTYPYDREFEVKKTFWDVPDKSGLPYVMDGLSLGTAEKSFLYGHDWPSSYYKHLQERSMSGDFPWQQSISVDNADLPGQVEVKNEPESEDIFLGMPDVTEYFEYENGKVMTVSAKNTYPELSEEQEEKFRVVYRDFTPKKNTKKTVNTAYTYEDDQMTSIKGNDYERKFYYENGLLIKSEYYRVGELLNTRIHYYKNSLKDRTEIFNRYNEAEYTITYEYEFW